MSPAPAQHRSTAPRGRRRAAPGSRPRPRRQPPTTRPPPTTTGWREARCPVVSNLPLPRVMQQRCHHASASARNPYWPPMPRPRLRAATPDQRLGRLSSPLRTEFFPPANGNSLYQRRVRAEQGNEDVTIASAGGLSLHTLLSHNTGQRNFPFKLN
jgi:hypothetical protein